MNMYRVIWLNGGESFHRTSEGASNTALSRTGANTLQEVRRGLWLIEDGEHAAMGVIEQIQIGE